MKFFCFFSLDLFCILILSLVFTLGQGQVDSNTSCNKYMENMRRHGRMIIGKIEIPMDANTQGFQIRLKFNKNVRGVEMKPLKGKMMDTRKEYKFDSEDLMSNGKLKMELRVKLRTQFSHPPKLIRILHNDNIVCGEPLSQDQDESNDTITIDNPHVSFTTRKSTTNYGFIGDGDDY